MAEIRGEHSSIDIDNDNSTACREPKVATVDTRVCVDRLAE